MPGEVNPDTNFKVIDKRSPETQAKAAEMPEPDHIGDVNEMMLKPCGCCGVDAYEACSEGEYYYNLTVGCKKCAAEMTSYPDYKPGALEKARKEIYQAWNRRTPEPGTSVVRWQRYDGTPETLPEDGREVICFYEGRHASFSKGYAVGTMWAYLPQPPQE